MLKSMQEVLEYDFSVLNKVYFNDKLPTIVITIMSSPRSNVSIPAHFEPPVRTLRATVPENGSHIFR